MADNRTDFGTGASPSGVQIDPTCPPNANPFARAAGPEVESEKARGRERVADTPPFGRTNRSVGELLRDLSRESVTLIRQEALLAKAEIREKAAIVSRNAAAIAAGGAVLFAGVLLLFNAIAGALATWMANAGVSFGVYSWLAPLIVAVVALGIGWAMVAAGLKKLKAENLAPTRTAESLKNTRDWMKEKVA
jgi:hypothetical protein